jgi:shikimate dehydrogenase
VPFKFQAAAGHHAATAPRWPRPATPCASTGAVHGDNTDGIGLVNDIQRNAGVSLAGRDVLLIGAGGAAPACWRRC